MVRDLFTNEKKELSTSRTIQMLAAVTLCAGFILSIMLEKRVSGDLGFAIAALAGWTGTSKGYVDYKKKTADIDRM